ncbi:UDP-glucose 4-epimerase GalE [Candidatus Poriferisodalis sp.]|uniref:UDP-glucose 4-epimerase GalE n=1 Tax=Candidatus Poriferisodalis sp. TaxID=3101277 RepID=UPI003B51A277
MTTLVTGGAGYVGSHCVVALHAAGRDVVILDDFSNAKRSVVDALRSLTGCQLDVVEGDASDRITIARLFGTYDIDSIIHFAAYKSVPESVAEPLRYYRNNVTSTLSLAEAALERGVSRFVLSSSAVVYGTVAELPITEEIRLLPESPYGATKHMCERILVDASAVSDMQSVLLRYFNPVGGHSSGRLGESPLGEPQNLVPVVMQVANGMRPRLEIFGDDYDTPDGSAIRDYVHVMDLAEGHVAALDADLGRHRSRAFNLGTGVGTSVHEVVRSASEVTQRNIAFDVVARRPGDLAESWADCSRAAAELRWRARRDLKQMLADHWRFLRSHPSGLP